MTIFSVLISIINMLITHTLLTRKKSIIYCSVAFILNTLFISFTGGLAKKYITNQLTLKFSLYFIAFMYIIYIYLVFEEVLSKKIFTMFSIWMFSTLSLFLATISIEAFLGIVEKKYIPATVYILRICFQTILLFSIYFGLGKPYKRVLAIVPNRTIVFMSLYPIAAFFMLIKLFMNNYNISFVRFENNDSIYDMLFLSLFVMLGYVLVFVGIYSSSRMISFQYNYKIVENQVELQRQNYKTLNESLEQLYALKHDVRHHFSAIKSMLHQQNYKEAHQYIEQFNQNELSQALPALCQNFTADSIIKYYMSLAVSKNIEFKTKLNIPEDIGINPLDLCIILGNCLENAIDACDKLSTGTVKYIELMSDIVGAHIVIKIVNNFNGNIVKLDNILKTSKDDDGSAHGIGLSSTSETVKKYNGNLDIQYSSDKFEVTIIMCTGTYIHV